MKKVRNAQSYYQMYLNKSLDACSNDLTLVFKRILVTIEIFLFNWHFINPLHALVVFKSPFKHQKVSLVFSWGIERGQRHEIG